MTPIDIQANKELGTLQIQWSDKSATQIGFRDLRIDCRCALCVDEQTGKRILDPATVSEEIKIETMELVGNYAVRIRWSDNHDTGLYTWVHLKQIGQSI
ncbi:MAG: DUF971 domain-containing protein [Pirellulales bacterium]